MLRMTALGLVLAALVAGCAKGGIQPGGDFPQKTFSVQTDYEAAHRRGKEYFRVCHVEVVHRYGQQYVTSDGIDGRGTLGTITLYRANEPARPMVILQTEPDPEKRQFTRATATVWGVSPFDETELAAIERSIQTATPVCRADAG